jgi:predicted RNA-binding protein with PIN domain
MPSASGYTALLDGYNILLRHAAWAKLPLAEGRQRLVDWLAQCRWPVPVVRVRVIFDTREPHADSEQAIGAIRVQYASPSADAAIQAAIRASAHPQRLIIVTDDQEILATARAHGARCLPPAALRAAQIAARPSRQGSEEPKAGLSAARARAITEELARRWLKPPAR